MTRVLFVALHGGANYASPDTAEEFRSLAQAAREYDSRRYQRYYPCWGDPGWADYNNDGRAHAGFAYFVGPDDPEWADVSTESDAHGGRVLTSLDLYPNYELTVGPRGGLRWERC